MERSVEQFRQYVADRIRILRDSGTNSRNAYLSAADRILDRRRREKIPGLWEHPPLMITATLDDGWGHGLEVIHRFAEAVGLECMPLGLLQKPETIIEACRQHLPGFLGLTVLQFDSEDALRLIREAIPTRTRIVAGGPLFRADPEFARRTGIDTAARNAVDFLEFMLDISRENVP